MSGLQWVRPENLALFGAGLLVCSMIFSPFMLSISMWLLVIAGLWQAALSDMARRSGAFSVLHMFSAFFRNWLNRTELWAIGLLLVMVALSGFWSENKHEWWVRTRVRIPFFVLPAVFGSFPPLSKSQYLGVLYLLFWVLVVTNIGVMVNFGMHYPYFMDLLAKGQHIAVPRNHIRFSMINATGIVTGGWLWFNGYYFRYRQERHAIAAGCIFLVVVLHVLAVRSGVTALYTAAIFTLFWLAFVEKRWKQVLPALLLCVFGSVALLSAIPSLRQKVSYMRYDWQQLRAGGGTHYSDSDRWISLEAGVQVFRKNPVLGVGAGDVMAAVQGYVKEAHPAYRESPKLPHNQFVYIAAGTGVLGLLLSLFALTAGWFCGTHRRFFLFWAFQVIVFTSFAVEYTLETAIGAAFYLFYHLWFLHLGRINDE